MRRFIARIALLAVASLGFISIIGAAPASAANCSVYYTAIYYNGLNMQYSHFASSCTDVDLVEFSPLYLGTGGIITGIRDVTDNQSYHYTASPPTLLDVICGRIGVTFTGQCYWYGHVHLWGCGPQPHWLYSTSQYRIHNKGGAWGPWHPALTNPNQLLNC